MFKITQPVALYKKNQAIAYFENLMELAQSSGCDISKLFSAAESGANIDLVLKKKHVMRKVTIKQANDEVFDNVQQFKHKRNTRRLLGVLFLIGVFLLTGCIGVHQAHKMHQECGACLVK